MTSSTNDPRAVVIRYVKAVADGDLAVIRDSFAVDATWTYPGRLPLSGTWRGRDAIIDEFLVGAGALFGPGGAVIELGRVVAEGDTVVAEWTSDAVTITGAEYHNRCLGVFTVADGAITSVTEYADTLHTAQVLFPNSAAGEVSGPAAGQARRPA
jgi:uncharacterized protein